jgi:hypothetical protein
MLAMVNSTAAALRQKAVSAGTVLLIGCGLGLYQVTSLVLASPHGHQIYLSLGIPTVDGEELAAPLESDVHAVVGERSVVAHREATTKSVVHRQAALDGRTIAVAAPAPASVALVAPAAVPVVAPVSAPAGHADRDHGLERHNPGRNGQQ